MKVVTGEQMVELDRRTMREYGVAERTLIQRAGKGAAQWIQKHYPAASWEVWVVLGRGNNGADGKVVARVLRHKGYRVHLLKAWEPRTIKSLAQLRRFPSAKGRKSLVVDAIFGTGLNRPVSGGYLQVIQGINASGVRVVSLDIPSGLHSSTGKILGAAVVAQETLTFGLPKLGLVLEQTVDVVGQIHVLDIGFPKDLIDQVKTPYEVLERRSFYDYLRPRKRSSYKNRLGHVLVLGGSSGYAGAPVLAARAALRAGAGLVSMGVPRSIYPIAAIMAGPEVMTFPCDDGDDGFMGSASLREIGLHLKSATAVVMGPGLGRADPTRHWLVALCKKVRQPWVLDADALNLIALDAHCLRNFKGNAVVTPHPGEMSRLSGFEIQEVQQNRFKVSMDFAKQHGVTVVLKGARTVIAHPKLLGGGDGFRWSINALAGSPGLAVGGSGDVLAGILGALLARGIPLSDASRMGVYLHATAGDHSLRSTGGDSILKLIEALPGVTRGE